MFSEYYVGIFSMLPVILLSLIIQVYMQSTYRKFSSVGNSKGMSGAEMAETILRNAGIHDVSVVCGRGVLSDHYNPAKKVVSLSPDVFNGTSISAIGVAAHECGHAIQHNVGYFPLRLRNGIVGITNFSSKLLYILIIASFFMASSTAFSPIIFNTVVICYAILFFFQLITLPTEFNASSRAIAKIKMSSFSEEDVAGVKKVLTSAALTYVAAAIHSLYQLLIIISRNQNRR